MELLQTYATNHNLSGFEQETSRYMTNMGGTSEPPRTGWKPTLGLKGGMAEVDPWCHHGRLGTAVRCGTTSQLLSPMEDVTGNGGYNWV